VSPAAVRLIQEALGISKEYAKGKNDSSFRQSL
jgi:hypothetical protein